MRAAVVIRSRRRASQDARPGSRYQAVGRNGFKNEEKSNEQVTTAFGRGAGSVVWMRVHWTGSISSNHEHADRHHQRGRRRDHSSPRSGEFVRQQRGYQMGLRQRPFRLCVPAGRHQVRGQPYAAPSQLGLQDLPRSRHGLQELHANASRSEGVPLQQDRTARRRRLLQVRRQGRTGRRRHADRAGPVGQAQVT